VAYFFLAALFCAGFVLLKVYDHKVASFGGAFERFTGHFWSKMCDAAQLHFVLCFFRRVAQRASSPQSDQPKRK
jgi:hypothetical protein